MIEQRPEGQPQAYSPEIFNIQLAIFFLLSTGITLIVFGAAYIKDLQTLKAVPNALWDAICGKPNPDGITLPLLLAVGTTALLLALGLSIWQQFQQRRQMTSTH